VQPDGASGTAKPAADPAAKTTAAPPAAPSGEESGVELAPAPDGTGTLRRESLRPSYAARSGSSRSNVLVGRVESEAGEPRGEVPVSVSSRANSSIHHDGLTNAFGGFAIRLTDGEWIVKVTMPSGRVYAVRQITVAGGKITDERREVVHDLIISY
jgi:hypothetical protein